MRSDTGMQPIQKAFSRAPALRTSVRNPVPGIAMASIAALMLSCQGGVQAQLPQPPDVPVQNTEQEDALQRLPSERRVVQQLEELSAAAASGDSGTVRDLLETLRAADPMLLVPEPRGTFVPLHRDLILRIQKFSPDLIRALQLESPVADAALQRELADAGISRLVFVLHRYSGTNASLQAHLLLAAMHLDRGHSQAAEYWLAPVLDNNTAPKLRMAAEQFRSRIARTANSESEAGSDPSRQERTPLDASVPPVEPGNSPPNDSVPNDSPVSDSPVPESESRPDQTTDEHQTSPTEPLAEHQTRYLHWMQSLPLPARARRLSQDLVQGSPEHGIVPWSAWEPVVDDQKIYVRSPRIISAFDRRTGQRVWTRTINRKNDSPDEVEEDEPMFRTPMDESALNSAMNSPEIQQLHCNQLVGRMTSDGLRLYAVCQIVEGTPLSSATGAIPLRLMIGRGDRLSAGLWELIAIDKESGRRLWTMGGPPVEERFGNELAMAWFAGPPAVRGHELFGVVERSGILELICVSAETGQLNWMIPLVYPEAEISEDPVRQTLAARILAEAGLVYTTTTTGWIFAVDSVTQSVLWARRLPVPQTEISRVRGIRNSAISQMQLLPLSQTWRSDSPHLCKGALVLTSSESRQLIILDPVSGRIRFRSSVDGATLVMFLNEEMLITASPSSMQAMRLPDMKKLWSTTRKNRNAVPVGQGVMSGGHLLIPMTDGSLEVIDPADGRLIAVLNGLRPSYSSGGLFSAGSDVVSYAPNHLALIALSPADRLTDPDPLEQATFLMETGRLADARETLSRVVVDALNAEPVRRLQFRIAVGQFASGDVQPENGIQEIVLAAQTNEERALSHFLHLEHQLKLSPQTAVPSLIEVLREDDAVLSVEIPETSALYATLRTSTAENPLAVSSLTSGTETLRRPVRSWILQQLQRLLAESDSDGEGSLLQIIGQLPDEDLLGMHSADLASEYLRRAEQHVQSGSLTETTLHLLMAGIKSRDMQSASGDRTISTEVVRRLNDILDQIQSFADQNPGHHAGQQWLVRRMLDVLRYDLLRAAGTKNLMVLPSPREAIVDRWAASSAASYTMVPVSTVGHMSFRNPNVRSLELRSGEDLFLSAFDWSLRREPGALIARSLLDPALPPWNLKTNVTENTFLQADEDVMRFGSVVIMQNMMGLSAFSVVDGKWLWSRRMPGGLRRSVLSIVNRPFRDFSATTNADTIYGQGRRICGATDRWICLMSEGTLEVMDLLNGRRLWTMSGFKSGSQVFACNSVIRVFGLKSEDCLALNPVDGSAREPVTQSTADELGMRTICSSGDALVVWNSGTFANRERAIDWIDPETLEVIRSVELSDMEYAQFLNPETCVAVTGDQTFHVVSLTTGERQTLSFAKLEQDETPEPVVQRIAFAADSANYYVYEQADGGLPMMAGAMYGLRAEVISRELRAVSRRSGTLAWIRPAEDHMLACIRGGSDPVLLIVRIINAAPANPQPLPRLPIQTGQRYLVDGVSRITGNKLLTYPVVSQAPFPSLRLTSSAEGMLDLEAFGNRVRFIPVAPTPAPENN